MVLVIEITLKPGTYVVAVSGGVDSVVLLDVLSKRHASQNEIQPTRLVIAHFDHGMRKDSKKDRQFVAGLVEHYGHTFVYGETQLGKDASEDAARQARYSFLRKLMDSVDARAIVTAHHQDDALETAVFNLLRGTGRYGVMLRETSEDIWRPLLPYNKNTLRAYAKKHNLHWREDSTNQDTSYSRNYIRNVLLKQLSSKQRKNLDNYINRTRQLDEDIEACLAQLLHQQPSTYQLNREFFSALPHMVAKEFLVYWLRQNQVYGFDRKTIERLSVAIKTGRPGKRYDVVDGKIIALATQSATLKNQPRKD